MADLTPPLVDDPGDWGITWATLPNAPAGVTDEGQQQALIAAAVAACWYLTGRQYGRHRSGVVRPCLTCPHVAAGGLSCGCTWYDRLDLDPSGGPSGGPCDAPVLAIHSVQVDGVDLDPQTDYGVVNNRWLVRTPAGLTWPGCQDYAADPPPLALDWSWGRMPSYDLTVNGVAALVDQLARALLRQPCDLDPAVVRTVQREGVSFALIAPDKAWERGYTGHGGVDAACVRAWPYGPAVQQAPSVFDPAALVGGPSVVRFERATPTD